MSLSPPSRGSYWMQRALALARERRGFCAPNPAVGAVVMKNNELVGVGSHWACGEPHAEVMALRHAGEQARGADLYVTLEPCCHQGRTPPCTHLIIQQGIKRVFYGIVDPNPQVAGSGRASLQAAGVICEPLPLPEVTQFYQSYCYWWARRRPWVTVKLAMSLDGKIAAPGGRPVVLTGVECQRLTHQWRYHSDAILTTARTVLADDPQLNVRLVPGKRFTEAGKVETVDQVIAKPVYVLDQHLQLPTSIRLLQTSQCLTLFYQDTARYSGLEQIVRWQYLDVHCVPIPVSSDSHTHLDWASILDWLGAQGIHDLWVEAGGTCAQTLWAGGYAQRLLLYMAPQILGEAAIPAFRQPISLLQPSATQHWQPVGDDMVLTVEVNPD